MAERKSLLDDAAFDKIGSKGGAKKSKGGGDQLKLIVAVALFLVAGGLLGWQFGLFDSITAPKGGTIQLTEAEVKAKEDQKKIQEIQAANPNNTIGSN